MEGSIVTGGRRPGIRTGTPRSQADRRTRSGYADLQFLHQSQHSQIYLLLDRIEFLDGRRRGEIIDADQKRRTRNIVEKDGTALDSRNGEYPPDAGDQIVQQRGRRRQADLQPQLSLS